MELLLVTASWPNALVPEFLDDEVSYLAERFDRVVVAPMRPRGPRSVTLPDRVIIDYSLSDHLSRHRYSPARASRAVTGAIRAAQPNSAGPGFSARDISLDGLRSGWLRKALLNRADSKTAALWAASRRPPDIAYSFWLCAATVGMRQAWPHIPLVSRVHGGDLFSEAHGWASIPYQKAAIEAADLVASVSDRGRAYLLRKFPDASHKITWRRLGIVDLGSLALPPDAPTLNLISVSSIDANKRVSRIAEVALSLSQSGHAVRWTHLGDGPGMASVRRTLLGGADHLDVDLAGQVPADEARRRLTVGGHNVFINLSLSEGAPVSLMEAQCVGLPVVATAVGGTPEVVPRALNEHVGTEDTLETLCEAVLRAAARPPEERHERRQNWARRYDANANYSAWANELCRFASK